ncbi:dTDP-4-dehydrorhamnose reductase [Thalassovita gelatinovora]|uniref:dTDP-4-dehydrorhamnose reductase n=1 Tax=Thalassovita gelatinovora TaxID=53501 RepID=UPI0008CCA9FA|nr:dTDP-4-dehydrorhamnose reductase [Thalassovita gelatinovora]QIZ82680.1 dTDP-4-dehydrorhamnose reductase [Thalassovita gelatinovora]SER11631.1 dTDP-4-dehydrorhamnose reductase [Thalassovita gelatinovora]
MKILVFGETGQVGREVQRRGGAVVLEMRGRDAANFEDPESCARLVTETDADAVINAVAYTAVDKAEDDAARARLINATTPGAIARAAAARGLPMVQISTDYVFDGKGTAPFAPDHPTGPLGIYGRTKLEGEDLVEAAGGAYAILRTSWVVSAHGNNFVKTMLRLGAERDQLNIVADQVGGPTPADDIADACLSIARQLCRDPGKAGRYHFSGAPDVSWADFAREIFARSGTACAVSNIPTSAYPTPAKRPLNSRLDNSATEAVFGIARPDWRAGLTRILQELDAIS